LKDWNMSGKKKPVQLTQDRSGAGSGVIAAGILIGIGLLLVAATSRDEETKTDVNANLAKVAGPHPGLTAF
jgi:hypothetical protein